MTLYALTTFLSAFLLFLVQPLIGKYILPWFGGGPGVWTTCLLFFQTLLLGGYAYAHFTSTRLKPRAQALTHIALLALSLVWLPIIPGAGWKPAAGDEPTLRIFLLLTATLGLPYLLLSATGPLLQRWFSLTHPDKSPYRLYALSNVASLLALVGYPFAIEPLFSRTAQAWSWSVRLGCFAALCGACAWRFRRTQPPGLAPAAAEAGPDADQPTRGQKFLWVALPALASVLLVATTSKLCVDVAVIPFLWILPLALYLLSFIICFDHARWYSRGVFAALLVVAGVLVWYYLSDGRHDRMARQVCGYSVALFAACMICHGEAYRLRPAARHLTNFYLHLSLGGALGGLCVAVLAPLVFNDHYELQIAYWAVALLLAVIGLRQRSRALVLGVAVGTLAGAVALPWCLLDNSGKTTGLLAQAIRFLSYCRTFYLGQPVWTSVVLLALLWSLLARGRAPTGSWRWGFAALPTALLALLGTAFVVQIRERNADQLESVRNFYGTLKVRRYHEPGQTSDYHVLSHGITTHGLQRRRLLYDTWTTSYYGRKSGIGLILQDTEPVQGGRNFGFVGLGAGTLAAYGLPGDRLRFYEINPAVPRLARKHFTFLSSTAAADVQIVLGDARLSLENELAHGDVQHFDVLVLDAFSSDAIPIHLLTQEAFAVYLRHLKPDGVIAVHISNRYLNLQPVVAGLAENYHLNLLAISETPEKKHWWLYSSNWVLLSRDARRFAPADLQKAADKPKAGAAKPVLWTDDRASLTGVLR